MHRRLPGRPRHGPPALRWGAALILAALLTGGRASAQTESQATLERRDATLVLTLKAPAAAGGRFIINNRNCEEQVRTTMLYGPDPGYVLTQVDENTSLVSNVAIIRSPLAATSDTAGAPASVADGATPTPSGEDQTLELYDGTVTFDRPGCIATSERADQPGVRMDQGRTTVLGTRFFLDRGADTGTMDGPIQLTRAAEGDAAGIEASADAMVLGLQDKHATFNGNVRVTSNERVTTAETLELDEGAGTAVLTGNPARSTRGSDVLEGSRLLYYLDSDDVVVLGGVHGDLQVDIPATP